MAKRCVEDVTTAETKHKEKEITQESRTLATSMDMAVKK